MPQKRFVADALGVVTICLVGVLVLLGLICIVYSFYFRTRIRSQSFTQLGYFSGPWIIRIAFILFVIWWGVGEIVRLNFLRREGRVLNNLEWQRTVCKCYIVSNLGFAEPCFFLTLVFLLRASLQKTELGTLSQKWNCKIAGCILLCCFPIFVLQLMVIVLGPKYNEGGSYSHQLPHYFTNTISASTRKNNAGVGFCTYPLFSTIFLGIFAMVLTTYLFWLGRRILYLVINKGLQKRVYTILSVSSFFPLRVLLLGLSVLSKPEHFWFEALAFLAFLSFLCCAGVGVCILVYLPVADSLALTNLQDIEARRRIGDEQVDTVSLITNQSPLEEISSGRNSGTSAKCGSISFQTMDKGETSGAFVELSLFSPSQHSSPPGSPQLLGWPMLPIAQLQEP